MILLRRAAAAQFVADHALISADVWASLQETCKNFTVETPECDSVRAIGGSPWRGTCVCGETGLMRVCGHAGRWRRV